MMNFETRLIKRASVWLFHAISLILIDERQSKHKSASRIKREIRITVLLSQFWESILHKLLSTWAKGGRLGWGGEIVLLIKQSRDIFNEITWVTEFDPGLISDKWSIIEPTEICGIPSELRQGGKRRWHYPSTLNDKPLFCENKKKKKDFSNSFAFGGFN